jgi:hypothetical protein
MRIWLHALNLAAALLTVFGIVSLFYTAFFSAAVLLLSSTIIIAALLAYIRYAPPTIQTAKRFYMDLADPKGHEARIRIENEIIPIASHITTLRERGLSATGRIEFNSVNVGRLVLPPDREGGLNVLITAFADPLPVLKKLSHVLTLTMWDTFKNERESHTAIAWRKIGVLEMHITFPSTRLCKEATCYELIGGTAIALPVDVRSTDGRHIDWVIRLPRVGSQYRISWWW